MMYSEEDDCIAEVTCRYIASEIAKGFLRGGQLQAKFLVEQLQHI